MTAAIIIVVAIVIIAALAVVAEMTRRRRLQEQFGPEYDRAVTEQNSRLRAEAELTSRQRRVRKFDIRPLNEAARAKYEADWAAIQEHFVDSPQAAVAEAYELLITVMTDRGYPTDDDEQVLADLSVEHGQTVGHFRAAQQISRSSAAGEAATEDLRQAFIHYRALFSDLLGVTEAALTGTTAPAAAAPATNPAPAPTDPSGIVVGAPAADLPDSQR
jgi:FtsZ-interacting cell division protein ZipA